METIWPYPEEEPAFEKSGAYTAWIAATDNKVHSGAAWRVQVKGDEMATPVERAKPSDGKSTSQRAILGALVGALETLPPVSTVDVYTNGQYVTDLIDNFNEKRACGWESSDGPLANIDLLKRIEKVRTERQIEWSVHQVTKGKQPHSSIIEHLRRLARSVCRDAS